MVAGWYSALLFLFSILFSLSACTKNIVKLPLKTGDAAVVQRTVNQHRTIFTGWKSWEINIFGEKELHKIMGIGEWWWRPWSGLIQTWPLFINLTLFKHVCFTLGWGKVYEKILKLSGGRQVVLVSACLLRMQNKKQRTKGFEHFCPI